MLMTSAKRREGCKEFIFISNVTWGRGGGASSFQRPRSTFCKQI